MHSNTQYYAHGPVAADVLQITKQKFRAYSHYALRPQ